MGETGWYAPTYGSGYDYGYSSGFTGTSQVVIR